MPDHVARHLFSWNFPIFVFMNDFIASILLLGAMGGGTDLPFWAASNNFGLMPQGSGGLALVQAYSQNNPLISGNMNWDFGASLGASTAGGTNTLLVDELYAGAGWKQLNLKAGMMHHRRDFLAGGTAIGGDCTLGSLSTTGGHMIWSGNARTMPGYTLSLEPLAVPFTSQRLWIRGSYGDYRTLGDRYVDAGLIHSTKIFFTYNITGRLDFELGLDHYAVWGGRGEKVPAKASLSNYFRVVIGKNAGPDGTGSDRANVIGDQGGAELLKLVYRADDWTLTAQHEIPYADGSGMMLKNFPDGVNTLCFSFKDKERWVSDILYEYAYTLYQSGSINLESWREETMGPKPKGTTFGGDNYFNNGEYRDGWTHFGRTIGYPLFFPRTPDKNGCTPGVSNNRLRAHHLGIGGKFFRKYPYKLMMTYSMDQGTYSSPYVGEKQWQKPWKSVKESHLRQISVGLTGEVPFKDSFALTYGVFADKGEVLEDQFGATLGLRCFLGRPPHSRR